MSNHNISKSIVIKYCDRCKWDDRGSWTKEDLDDGKLKKCPTCSSDLFEAEGYDDIP